MSGYLVVDDFNILIKNSCFVVLKNGEVVAKGKVVDDTIDYTEDTYLDNEDLELIELTILGGE